MKITVNDTPATIAAKFLGGMLDASPTEAMLEIRKRSAAMENRLDKAKEELSRRRKLGAVA